MILQGWTNEEELDRNLRAMKEESLQTSPGMIMYDAEKNLTPDTRLKIRSPPRLDTQVTRGIRDAAVKAFQVQLFERFIMIWAIFKDKRLSCIWTEEWKQHIYPHDIQNM